MSFEMAYHALSCGRWLWDEIDVFFLFISSMGQGFFEWTIWILIWEAVHEPSCYIVPDNLSGSIYFESEWYVAKACIWDELDKVYLFVEKERESERDKWLFHALIVTLVILWNALLYFQIDVLDVLESTFHVTVDARKY